MSKLLVYVEHAAGAPRRASLEAIGAALAAGCEVVACLAGDGAADAAAGALGASAAVVLTGAASNSPDAVAAALAEVAQAQSAQGFLAAATSAGKDLAPRVAAHLDSTLFTDLSLIHI